MRKVSDFDPSEKNQFLLCSTARTARFSEAKPRLPAKVHIDGSPPSHTLNMRDKICTRKMQIHPETRRDRAIRMPDI